MAKMWPERLPAEVRNHPFRSSEVKVYDRLRQELDDRFTVYYSRPWLGLSATGEEVDGECDFLVAHPALGILAIEVKGGGISYEPALDTWSSRNRHGTVSRIKSPIHQARTAKHTFVRKLKERRGLENRYIRARHGIIFPDCENVSGAPLGPDMPAQLFCCAQRFEHDLSGWIRSRMEAPEPGEAAHQAEQFGPTGMAELERLLATPFSLRIPLANRLRESLQEAEVLTLQQSFILRGMADIERVAISGPAGSGKTVLSMQEALRLVDEGLNVVWLCYNNPLAEKMRSLAPASPRLRVLSFHQFCTRAMLRANITADESDKQRYFEELLPDAAIAAIDLFPDLGADAVVVDEGQDFLPLWWTVIDAMLEVRPRHILRIFYDANQRLYRNRQLPQNLMTFQLTRNLRNTRQIFAEARHLHVLPSGQAVEAAGPDGVPVIRNPLHPSADVVKAVIAQVMRLVRVEKVPLGEIAVLTSTRELADSLQTNIPVAASRSEAPESLIIDTVRRFKGLDRPAVVVAVDELLAANDELTYVALSRASGLLALVGQPDCLAALSPSDTPDSVS